MNPNRLRRFLRWFAPYSVRLTPEGSRFVLLTLGVGGAAVNTGNNLLYLLLAMMLSLIVVSGLLSERCLRGLLVRRRLPEQVYANRPAMASLSVANKKPRFPTFALQVQDVVGGVAVDRGIHVASLPPGGFSLQTYPILFPRRGLYRIEGVRLQTRFPFGLFQKAVTRPLATEIVVYPEIVPLPDRLARELAVAGDEQSLPQRGPGSGLSNLRDYEPGDDSRRIHWKTSARQARLTIRETELEDLRRVTLALPTVWPAGGTAEPSVPAAVAAAFERAVSLMASLAASFEERGYSLRLLAGSDEVPFGAGPAHLHRILRTLALCQPTVAGPSQELPMGWRDLGARGASGELAILILPWVDPRLEQACRGVGRIVRPGDAL